MGLATLKDFILWMTLIQTISTGVEVGLAKAVCFTLPLFLELFRSEPGPGRAIELSSAIHPDKQVDQQY